LRNSWALVFCNGVSNAGGGKYNGMIDSCTTASKRTHIYFKRALQLLMNRYG